jgi:microcystin-dependent protein
MANLVDLAWSTLASTPTTPTTNTTLPVTTGDGALFATVPMKALLCPPGVIPTKANSEAVLITARSTDNLTVTRDYKNWNGGVGRNIAAGWILMQTPFADDFQNMSIVNGETPGGTVNGSNNAFTTASLFRTGSLRVYLNGQRLTAGASADYTENASGNGFAMTSNTVPATGDILVVDYLVGDTVYSVGGNSIVSDEAVTGLVNGSNTSYTTNRAYIATSLEVYLDGVHQIRGTDYTETTPGTGVFTMTNAPVSGSILRVNYQFNLAPSSNADTVDGQHAATLTPPGVINPYAGRFAPSGWLVCDGSAVSRASWPALFQAIVPMIGQPTLTIASPGVFTLLAHGLLNGDMVYLETTGALPTGLTADTIYYVVSVTTNTFQLALTAGGTAINTTGSQSGIHNLFFCPYGLGNGTSTFNVPDMRGRVPAGADGLGGTAASRLTLAQSQGVRGNQGANGGEQGHQITIAELAQHNHPFSDPGFAPGVANRDDNAGGIGRYGRFGGGLNTSNVGSDTPHNNVQPTLVVNYIIKAA